MFEEALKLYLKYPAEMEYWYGKEDKEIDKVLVSEITEGEEETFLSALSEVYELALEQFKDSIISPLREALNNAGNEKGIALSLRWKKYYIAGQDFGGRVRSKNNKGDGFYRSIGCNFRIQKSGDESVLNVYPWVWTRGGRAEAQRLAERLGDGWCVCVSDGWYSGTIRHEPRISIRPESKSEAVVESIAGCLVPQMRLLAQETTHPAH